MRPVRALSSLRTRIISRSIRLRSIRGKPHITVPPFLQETSTCSASYERRRDARITAHPIRRMFPIPVRLIPERRIRSLSELFPLIPRMLIRTKRRARELLLPQEKRLLKNAAFRAERHILSKDLQADSMLRFRTTNFQFLKDSEVRNRDL